MKAYFHQLFDYNYYCNKQIIEACVALGKVPQRSQELFSHILNAHHIWNARILQRNPEYGVWEKHGMDTWGGIHYDNQRDSFEIITNADPLDSRIIYENTEGKSFSNSLVDILFHIINHSTYHRGQLASDFRQHGIDPLPLDYIHYKR